MKEAYFLKTKSSLALQGGGIRWILIGGTRKTLTPESLKPVMFVPVFRL